MAHVLIAEDDPDLLEMARLTLQRAGHRVACARDGAEAVTAAQLADEPFDAFVLDVAMPNLTGVEVVRRLRALPAYERTPICMLTATLGDAALEAAFCAGADEYMTKPYRLRELAERIAVLTTPRRVPMPGQ